MEQGTEEWFKIRKGKMTASHATAIATCGKGLETYIFEMMAEYYSSGEKDSYSNKHLERGNELEPQARSIYELEKGVTVKQVGFIEHNDYVGGSPDGLVNEDGLLEIKCPDDKGFFNVLMKGEREISTGYEWQCQHNMLVSGRKWCDIMLYNPNYSQSYFIYRFYADEDKFKKLMIGFEVGEEMIKQVKNKFNK